MKTPNLKEFKLDCDSLDSIKYRGRISPVVLILSDNNIEKDGSITIKYERHFGAKIDSQRNKICEMGTVLVGDFRKKSLTVSDRIGKINPVVMISPDEGKSLKIKYERRKSALKTLML